jgi:hypothetical protein
LRIATLLLAVLHVIHFAMLTFAQPVPKFSDMRWRATSRYSTRIKTNVMCETDEPIL